MTIPAPRFFCVCVCVCAQLRLEKIGPENIPKESPMLRGMRYCCTACYTECCATQHIYTSKYIYMRIRRFDRDPFGERARSTCRVAVQKARPISFLFPCLVVTICLCVKYCFYIVLPTSTAVSVGRGRGRGCGSGVLVGGGDGVGVVVVAVVVVFVVVVVVVAVGVICGCCHSEGAPVLF